MEFQARELRKYFVVGDHVRVIAGRHEGETGLIVRIEPNLAVLLSDLALHEVMKTGLGHMITSWVTWWII